MEDQKIRTIAKTASWRALASLTTLAIVYGASREIALSLGVMAVEIVSKMVLYYGHERVWTRLAWGRNSSVTENRESTPDETHAEARPGR